MRSPGARLSAGPLRDQAHIIVAAELTNNAADSGQLTPLLEAVHSSTGELPAQLLADAGFRSQGQFELLADTAVELIVALGREGKQQLAIDAARYPRTAQMAARLETDEARAAYRRRKWLSGLGGRVQRALQSPISRALRSMRHELPHFHRVLEKDKLSSTTSLRSCSRPPRSTTPTRNA